MNSQGYNIFVCVLFVVVDLSIPYLLNQVLIFLVPHNMISGNLKSFEGPVLNCRGSTKRRALYCPPRSWLIYVSPRSWLIYLRTLLCRSNGSINYTARTIVRLYVSLENRAEWRATNLF
jgi:hypothetical protein